MILVRHVTTKLRKGERCRYFRGRNCLISRQNKRRQSKVRAATPISMTGVDLLPNYKLDSQSIITNDEPIAPDSYIHAA